jgi:hypothetical protein
VPISLYLTAEEQALKDLKDKENQRRSDLAVKKLVEELFKEFSKNEFGLSNESISPYLYFAGSEFLCRVRYKIMNAKLDLYLDLNHKAHDIFTISIIKDPLSKVVFEREVKFKDLVAQIQFLLPGFRSVHF